MAAFSLTDNSAMCLPQVRRATAREAVASFRLMAIMVALVVVLIPALGFDVDRRNLPLMILVPAILLVLGALFRLRGLSDLTPGFHPAGTRDRRLF